MLAREGLQEVARDAGPLPDVAHHGEGDVEEEDDTVALQKERKKTIYK